LAEVYNKNISDAVPKNLSKFSLACFGEAPTQCLSGNASPVERRDYIILQYEAAQTEQISQ